MINPCHSDDPAKYPHLSGGSLCFVANVDGLSLSNFHSDDPTKYPHLSGGSLCFVANVDGLSLSNFHS